MFPTARRHGLTVRPLGGELLVYDHQSNKVHCLNEVSALIWQHCDGRNSVAELVRRVQTRLRIADGSAMVHLALEQLRRRALVESAATAAPLPAAARWSRRDALKMLVAAAIALPVIATMTPKASAANTVSIRVACPAGTFLCALVGNGDIRLCCNSATEICRAGACVPKPPPPPSPPPE